MFQFLLLPFFIYHYHRYFSCENNNKIDSDEIDTFSVDKNSGKIKLVKPLDSNYRNHYRLIVKSEDSDGEPPKSDTAEVCLDYYYYFEN